MLRRFVLWGANPPTASEPRRGPVRGDLGIRHMSDDAGGRRTTPATRLLERAVHIGLVVCLLPALLLVLLVGVLGLLAGWIASSVRFLWSSAKGRPGS